ncbi:MAG: RnfABCDGE type electron transport complex subunit D [Planctomycetia bacterium]|nr:RnfABCDGE type electron transport complex subunit D [Planctomycetia bacterium]
MEKIQIASSPHLSRPNTSTRLMMLDVILALIPALAVGIWIFGWFAVKQVSLCILVCMLSEWFFNLLRGDKRASLDDLSAIVTGMILGLSLPWSAPWQVPVFASIIAVGLGKAAFGGLGFNIFNPAMVGRAFVMLSFATVMGSNAYEFPKEQITHEHETQVTVITQATPLKQIKEVMKSGAQIESQMTSDSLLIALTGQRNGSLGEVSVLAILLGGFYLLFRRTISWRIPLGMCFAVFLIGALVSPSTPFVYGSAYLLNGAVLFGAFFIATDPVTSPVTPRGHWIFGIGVGVLTMIIRLFSGYPEGVMFAVLMMNAVVPLINAWTIPQPFGGLPKTHS